MGNFFVGEHYHKVDKKGRVSIPQTFRQVIQDGDPERGPDGPFRFYLNYGQHLRNQLRIYTYEAFFREVERIENLTDTDDRKLLRDVFIGQSRDLEVDKDGRTLLPKAQRDKLGIEEGELYFKGAGLFFEIWIKEVYEATRRKKIEVRLSMFDEDDDIMDLLDKR
ncbi:division/cell wall cluster transcriptional repressor MraZ [Roseisalinus antarcticus]|uniref:Transcriptional regulator MraZ n=1 Tax=Roseisalinus antarcticus TaxID=254357 RepID=A0A1Y5SV04_9RHOB|nr:cell division/cell wall cluster transcriptional repressor MraZ [Roseisalinus antarcticus]SLN48464.1 cell division protein MraZ [Roseisalinus antarcticus]